MTYELCLEYGTYPLTVSNALLGQDNEVPEFIQHDQPLLDQLELMNSLFHDLFLTIECQFHYVGFEFPEKRHRIKSLYEEVSQYLIDTYPEQDITIEPFLLA
ncbi:hypothetical protein ACVRWQ_02655 [Streptococcus phocae subsp. salmonis]|uniref:Uncharacterized protein n=1 Tax=Streptococcus phocae TaxID=119224 RepID=A0A0P6S3Q0_9STRE|nr:hypothetical protein [Streptococcus phocae]KGR72737.1 hypothetical protein NX86_04505 [Streptococcus phocae subsp. salmonis]KPJ22741.1 hypothetical protein AKK44_03600 [Streptococcus phocae]